MRLWSVLKARVPLMKQAYIPVDRMCHCGKDRFPVQEVRTMADGTDRTMLVFRCVCGSTEGYTDVVLKNLR
jgi:hypothetical protein